MSVHNFLTSSVQTNRHTKRIIVLDTISQVITVLARKSMDEFRSREIRIWR